MYLKVFDKHCFFSIYHHNRHQENFGDYRQDMIMMRIYIRLYIVNLSISSAESQKGINADPGCSVENQKGAIAIDFVQQ